MAASMLLSDSPSEERRLLERVDVALHTLSVYIRQAETAAEREQRLLHTISQLRKLSSPDLSIASSDESFSTAASPSSSSDASSTASSSGGTSTRKRLSSAIDDEPQSHERSRVSKRRRSQPAAAAAATTAVTATATTGSRRSDYLHRHQQQQHHTASDSNAARASSNSSSSSSDSESPPSVSSRVFEPSLYVEFEKFLAELPSFVRFSSATRAPFFTTLLEKYVGLYPLASTHTNASTQPSLLPRTRASTAPATVTCNPRVRSTSPRRYPPHHHHAHGAERERVPPISLGGFFAASMSGHSSGHSQLYRLGLWQYLSRAKRKRKRRGRRDSLSHARHSALDIRFESYRVGSFGRA